MKLREFSAIFILQAMRFGPAFAILVAALCTASVSLADTVLVVVASDTGIYEDPVRTRAEEKAQDAGLTVRPFGEAVVESGVNPAELVRCVDKAPDCLVSAAELANVDRILIFQLKSAKDAEGVPQVVLSGSYFDARIGGKLESGQKFCESCTSLAGLVDVAAELCDDLLAAQSAGAGGATFIEIHSTPAGARMVIDGADVGPAGKPHAVTPGEHVIELTLSGYTAVRRTVDAKADQTTIERVELTEDSAGATAGLEPYYKWGALGAGALATTLGIVWIAVDGPQSEGGLRKPEERNTMVPGVVATAAGLGLLGLSGYLFYREYGAEERGAAAVAVPTNGGALLGVVGRF